MKLNIKKVRDENVQNIENCERIDKMQAVRIEIDAAPLSLTISELPQPRFGLSLPQQLQQTRETQMKSKST